MTITFTQGASISGICTCVPARKFDNLLETTRFDIEEVQKVVRMAGVRSRFIADDSVCSSDLCIAAAENLIERLGWERETIDGLVMVTQTPDYFLPSTACVVHKRLGLSDACAAFDLGLGCSGYPYGLWMAAMILQAHGFRRVLLLNGETPTRFSSNTDRSVALLFGDAGSATAVEGLEVGPSKNWVFSLHTDGSGTDDLIIEGGGFRNRFPEDRDRLFVKMNGSSIFNFTIKRVPPLVHETLAAADERIEDVDYFIFHQSNRFIMQHLAKKLGLPKGKMPFTIEDFGSTGGPSVPLTITQGQLNRPHDRALRILLLGYGVGLSWASALVDLPPSAVLDHIQLGNGR
jgi:3-oxoacyl-[acyl-carrier-protein] synthase-3